MNSPRFLTGRAIGGPRNGIMLAAGPSWSGYVTEREDKGGTKHSYPGRYIWVQEEHTWVWHSAETRSSQAPKPKSPQQ